MINFSKKYDRITNLESSFESLLLKIVKISSDINITK